MGMIFTVLCAAGFPLSLFLLHQADWQNHPVSELPSHSWWLSYNTPSPSYAQYLWYSAGIFLFIIFSFTAGLMLRSVYRRTASAEVFFFIIFLFTMTTKYYQPDIGLAALILSGACLGFLIFNRYPARIFLGEGGSLLLGYILGVLAIISGGKIAIALLVMGLPIMDVGWTIIRRVRTGKNPFKFADNKHLHFRLLDLGLGQRKTALIYYGFAGIFGLSALFLQSLGKALALGALLIIMLFIIIGFGYLDRKT